MTVHSPALEGAAAVVGLVERLAGTQGREDLRAELAALRATLAVQPVEVLVVGAPSQGRSAVVDALLGAPVCATGPGGVTVVPTTVRWGPEYGAAIVREPRPGEAASIEAAPFGQAVGLATAELNPANSWALRSIELAVPAPTVARGLALIDTPAITTVWSPDAARVIAAMGRVAAVALVTSAASPLTTGELDLLRLAAAACPRVVVVVNGTATYPAWRQVVDQDELLLEQRGVPAAVIAVDAAPYWTEAGGIAPGPDPGMQRLARHLTDTVLLEREQQRISTAITEAFWAADRLRLRLFAERALIGDDQAIDAASQRLSAASADAQALCAPDARWQIQLDEAAGQLGRDLRWDLDAERARLVQIAEQLGPYAGGEALAGFHQRLTDAVAHLQRMRKLSLRALAKGVAETFLEAANGIAAEVPQTSEAHALGVPRLDRLAPPDPGALRELPLALVAPAPAGVPTLHAWIDAALGLVQQENDAAVAATAAVLRARCTMRAIELHRSLVEVATAVHLLRGADAQLVLQRQQALTDELEQLATVDWQLGPR